MLLFGATALGLAGGDVERSVSPRGLAGAGTIVAGAALLTWSLAALRSWRFLPEIEPDHELCTTGPFALVRHPTYLALDLLGLGSLIWHVSVPMAVAAALLVLGGDLRARVEERALVESFGDRYRDYMMRVPRMIPGLRRDARGRAPRHPP